MIDKNPALIAKCVDAADVISAVNFARENHLDVAVRGGGHNGPGLGSVDNGLVVDLWLVGIVPVTYSVGESNAPVVMAIGDPAVVSI